MKQNNLTLGYACINMELRKDRIFTNRHMRQKTFEAKGLDYVSELALANIKDLETIVKWNNEHRIKLFRLSSQIFPWSDDYKLSDLKDDAEICDRMFNIGNIARQAGQRLTMHHGPFHCLASPNPKVVERTIIGLNKHSEQFNMMGY